MTQKAQWKASNKDATHELQISDMRIIVTRHIDYPKDEWIFLCDAVGYTSKMSLGRVTLEEAQGAAVMLVWSWLSVMLRAVEVWRNTE